MLLAIAILWFRNHNYHADRLAALHPDWTDEQLFLEARRWNIGENQKITFYDFLPAFLGIETAPAYEGYKTNIHPGATHLFQSAAMR